jgi:hypothetical protein
MVARSRSRHHVIGGALIACALAGFFALTGVPAQAAWHYVYIGHGAGPMPVFYYYGGKSCQTIVFPNGPSYSTCNTPGYMYYYYGRYPEYSVYYVAPGYYVYGR